VEGKSWGLQGSSHLSWGEIETTGFCWRRWTTDGKEAWLGLTGWWCSDSSPLMWRGETDANRHHGSRGCVDLLRDGSCLAKQATSDGGAPAALRASSGSCAVRKEESGEEVQIVQELGVPFIGRRGKRRGRQGSGGAPVAATIKARWSSGGEAVSGEDARQHVDAPLRMQAHSMEGRGKRGHKGGGRWCTTMGRWPAGGRRKGGQVGPVHQWVR
jgi:hypothetical protein